MSIFRTALVAGLLTAQACSATAADVYRWVDDKGVTNLSDVVPEKYRKVAQKVETPVEPDDAGRRAAPVRTAAAASTAASSSAAAASGVRRTVATGVSPARPASGAGALSASADGEDCATLQRRYKESQDCFGPQPRTINGAINGARAPQCPVVVDPSPRCGLPSVEEPAPTTTAP